MLIVPKYGIVSFRFPVLRPEASSIARRDLITFTLCVATTSFPPWESSSIDSRTVWIKFLSLFLSGNSGPLTGSKSPRNNVTEAVKAPKSMILQQKDLFSALRSAKYLHKTSREAFRQLNLLYSKRRSDFSMNGKCRRDSTEQYN